MRSEGGKLGFKGLGILRSTYDHYTQWIDEFIGQRKEHAEYQR